MGYQNGTTSASYAYDGNGLRTSRAVNGTSEGYVWDSAEGMPTILQDGSTRYITGPGGLPIEQVDGSGTVSYYIQDQLGSTRGLLDSSGTVTGTYTFTPYGEVKGHWGASTPFGYAGQYTDSESGLQYLRARYYDPSCAQFLTLDPMLSSTLEPYGYVGGNPMNAIDPLGAWSFPNVGGVAIGAVSTVVHAAGWVKHNAGTVAPYAIWGAAVVAVGACAYFTLGVCLAAFDAGVFTGGVLLLNAFMPPGADPLPLDGTDASCIVGRKVSPLIVGHDGQPPINAPGVVNGLEYSGHAFDHMQGRGFTPSVVENVLQHGAFQGTQEDGNRLFYDPENNITVVANSTGRVVTVGYGKMKLKK